MLYIIHTNIMFINSRKRSLIGCKIKCLLKYLRNKFNYPRSNYSKNYFKRNYNVLLYFKMTIVDNFYNLIYSFFPWYILHEISFRNTMITLSKPKCMTVYIRFAHTI